MYERFLFTRNMFLILVYTVNAIHKHIFYSVIIIFCYYLQKLKIAIALQSPHACREVSVSVLTWREECPAHLRARTLGSRGPPPAP